MTVLVTVLATVLVTVLVTVPVTVLVTILVTVLVTRRDLDLHEHGQRALVSYVRGYKEHQCHYIFQVISYEREIDPTP
jgi:hypothetical protein